MTNKEAIEFLKNMIDTQSVGAVLHNGEKALWQYHIEALNMAISALQPHWIPVTERLPDEPYGCLVTVWDTEPMTCEEFENILPYFVGWDGEQWNDYDGEQCPFEVIAWMPLPKAWRGEQE